MIQSRRNTCYRSGWKQKGSIVNLKLRTGFAATAQSSQSVPSRDSAADLEPKRLEVNLVFTDAQTAAAALGTVKCLARDLGTRIRLRAPVVVPRQLPLDEPAVSIRFIEDCLADLVSRLEHDGFESTAHVYLCRDRADALLQVLSPNSLLVIGGKKRWWPTTSGRVAKMLRSKGHRVVFVDDEGC
jgi:hypothetical protein